MKDIILTKKFVPHAAPLPSPTNVIVSRRSPATSIRLTWDQTLGADAVTGYKIVYTYEVIECRNENARHFPPVTVFLNNGALRSYTIIGSSTSPVEEDSNYVITVTAVNSVTESHPSNAVFTTTIHGGKVCYYHCKPNDYRRSHCSSWVCSVSQLQFN